MEFNTQKKNTDRHQVKKLHHKGIDEFHCISILRSTTAIMKRIAVRDGREIILFLVFVSITYFHY